MSERDHGGLKGAIYARMEQISFRSGAVAAGGVVAVGGIVIAHAVLPGGHHAAAVGTAAATPRSATPGSPATTPATTPVVAPPARNPRPRATPAAAVAPPEPSAPDLRFRPRPATAGREITRLRAAPGTCRRGRRMAATTEPVAAIAARASRS